MFIGKSYFTTLASQKIPFKRQKMVDRIPMKRTRDLAFVVALVCVNVSGFVPNFSLSRTNVVAVMGQVPSPTAELSISTISSIPNIPVESRKHGAPSKEKSQRSDGAPSKSKNKRVEEFNWLNWVYNQWRQVKPGDLSEEVLKQMVPAITRWGRRKTLNSAERAEELLNRIIKENLAGNPHAELTVNLFNAAMDAHAKVGNPEGVKRILRKLEAMSSKHDHLAHLAPDVFSMSTLATAWAKSRSPEAASKAVAILDYMDVRKLTPNTITYNAVLYALAVGSQIDKALRAEDVVRLMKARHEAGEDCKPDIYSYQSLIQAWSRTSMPGSPQRAELILRNLDAESEKGNKSLSPNAYCFTTTIHAWSRSAEKGRARSAYNLLNHMRKRYFETKSKSLKPNVIAFTAVLNACARPAEISERADAFKVAELTMAELSLGTFDKPNFLSYAAFLSVCCSTLAPGEMRDEVVRKTFEQCAEAGQVAQIVLGKLCIAASLELHDELVGKYMDENGVVSLPNSWTQCIKGERSGAEIEPGTVSNASTISWSSKLRLQEVEGKFGGKSGFYSSGKAPQRLESEGISWSKKSLGSKL